MEERKKQEQRFHDRLQEIPYIEEWPPDPTIEKFPSFYSNIKYYCITGSSYFFVLDWLKENCPKQSVLNYCCGGGIVTVLASKMNPKSMIGIDISSDSLKKIKERAKKEDSKAEFLCMDAENTGFCDNSFDIIFERGALHHLKLESAYKELARILKPEGKTLCIESLRHNPVFQAYRKMTPSLRTRWETKHILGKKEIDLAKNYFEKVEILGFFHLFSLLAVPFRKSFLFYPLLGALQKLDSIVLKLPIIKWNAWQVVFVLSQPKKRKNKIKQAFNHFEIRS